MRNVRRRVVAFLLVLAMVLMYCPDIPSAAATEASANASAQAVIMLNATELTGWPVGKTGTFYAYVNGTRVNNSTLNWSSSNTAVATCVNGVLTAKGPGTAIITCTRENAVEAKCTVTVKGNDVVTLNASELKNWIVGKTGSFYAYVNGKRVANKTLTWSSSNTSVATCVDGVLTAKGPGTAIISCTRANATTATCTVTVKGNDVVTLNTTSLTNWSVGKTGTFYAYVNGKRVANSTLAWSSSDTSVATCVNGVLTAKGPGTAVITCTKAGATAASCTVTVKGADVVTLNATELTNWTVGKSASFYAYVNGKRVANNILTWSSSNTAVAICENGVLTAKGAGTAIISCTKAGATVAKCTVTVKGNDVVTLNATSLTNWMVGQKGCFKAYVNGNQVPLNTMTWSSSNPTVATVINGYLVGVGEGTTVISCTKANGTVARCIVKVKVKELQDADFNIVDGVLKKYTGTSEKVVIPNGVTSIAEGAFECCFNLREVSLPNSCTSIGDRAFYYCYSLTKISIPNSVTSIGTQAFCGCTSLKEIKIPDSVRKIGFWAFEQCESLEEMWIPYSVTTIGSVFHDVAQNAVIYVERGSYAEQRAIEWGFTYQYIPSESLDNREYLNVEVLQSEEAVSVNFLKQFVDGWRDILLYAEDISMFHTAEEYMKMYPMVYEAEVQCVKEYMNGYCMFISIEQASARNLGYIYAYVTGDLSYLTTREQEAYMKILEVFDELDLEGKSDIDKILALHDYLLLNVAYDVEHLELRNNVEADRVEGAILGGKVVCAGYAATFRLLLLLQGIRCEYVANGGHAWNLVELDGKWYHVDVTWDDPVPDVEGRVVYTHFMMTDDMLARLDSHDNWICECRSEHVCDDESYHFYPYQ